MLSAHFVDIMNSFKKFSGAKVLPEVLIIMNRFRVVELHGGVDNFYIKLIVNK